MHNNTEQLVIRRIPLNDKLWFRHQGTELVGLIELVKRIRSYWGTALHSQYISVVPEDDLGLYDIFLLDLNFLLARSLLSVHDQEFIRESIPRQFIDSNLGLALDEDIKGQIQDSFRNVLSLLRQEAMIAGNHINDGDPTGLFSLFDEEIELIRTHSIDSVEQEEIRLGLRKPPQEGVILKVRCEEAEKTIRTLISEQLRHGWDDIPAKVRRSIKRRIEREVNRKPSSLPLDQRPLLERLEFCDLADLKSIIISPKNWPKFEKIFGEVEQIQIRFELLIPYRNDIAHHRQPNTIAHADANAAITWFEAALQR